MSQRFERPNYCALNGLKPVAHRANVKTTADTVPSASTSSNTGPSTSANNSTAIRAIDPALFKATEALVATEALCTSSLVSGDLHSTTYQSDEDEDDIRTPGTSILSSDSVSQTVPTKAPLLQRLLGPRSWVFEHFITTLLDTYYLFKKSKKRTQDRQHKCKYCLWHILDSIHWGTGNMIDHLKKHQIGLPTSSKPHTSIQDMLL
jgi:hypothetical protein